MKALAKNQAGNMMLTAMVVSSLVVMGSVAAYRRFGDTKESFRMARIRSLMSSVELQVRSRAAHPEAYSGCGGGGTCSVNPNFFSDLQHLPVAGAVCPPALPKCGLALTLKPFQAATNSFQAELKYEGMEVKPKPVAISVQVPLEILQADLFNCGATNPDLPIFTGFDPSSGQPICKGFNTCGAGEFVSRVNVSPHTLKCKRLPASISCPAQQLVSSLKWGGDTISVQCADLPAPPFDLGTAPPSDCTQQQFIAAKASMTSDTSVLGTDLATNCIDSVTPTMQDSLPTDPEKRLRFMNTCGNRWCTAKNFYGGRVIEYDGTNASVECRHKSPPPDLGINPACKTLLDALPPINRLPSSVSDIAQGCIDSANPTLADNMPTSPDSDTRFVNTCGNRYCLAHGYAAGNVIEYYAGQAIVQCYDAQTDSQGGTTPDPLAAIVAQKNQVRDNCLDAVNPTPADNEPSVNLERFMNTCGNRYCVQKLGYASGKVVEIPPDGTVLLNCYH